MIPTRAWVSANRARSEATRKSHTEGELEAALLADGKVFAMARAANQAWGSTLFTLDAATGENVWGPLDMGHNAWFAYGDGQVFVVNADGVVRSLDAATGRQRWIVRARELNRIDSPPVYRDGVIWYHAGVSYGGALYGLSAADGHVVTVQPRVSGETSAPAVSDDFVYSSHKCSAAVAMRPVDVKSGWSAGQTCSGGFGSMTPVLAEGLLWVRNTGPQTAFDARTGKAVVTFGGGFIEPAPAFDGGRGYFPYHGAMEARDPLTQDRLWSFAVDGGLTGAPIVVNGFVYVASASGQVWALDGPTGEVVWTGDAGAPILPNSETDYEPQLIGLAAGQGLVAVPASNLLVAFGSQGAPLRPATAASTGHVERQAQAAAAVSSPGAPLSDEATTVRLDPAHQSRAVAGREAAPLQKAWSRDLGFPVRYSLLAEGKVFAAAGGTLFAFDASTGADSWGPITLGPPPPGGGPFVAYGDGKVFAALAQGPLRAFDAATGAELWSKNLRLNEVLSAPPVYADGMLYLLNHGSELSAVSAASGRDLWRDCRAGNGVQPPSVADGRVYTVGGFNNVAAFDATTGANPWGAPTTYCVAESAYASAVAHGRLWAESLFDGTPLTFDTTSGKLVGAFGGALPAFDDEQYYVVHGTALKAKDLDTDFTEWTFTGDGPIATVPVVIDGLVYVGSASGRLWALDPSTGTPVWEGDAGAPIVPRGWHQYNDLGANIAAGQGLVVVPATNTLVAFEPESPPPAAVSSTMAWGWNPFGQVGDGSTVDRHAPVPMAGLADVVQVSAGSYHDLALKADGTVWATGWNGFGQLGDGTNVQRTVPVQVPGLTDVVEVAAGYLHSAALKKDGTVWAWGWNAMGQVGDGSATDRWRPVKVAGLTDVTHVAVGMAHTLAVKKDGAVWSWGWNALGQLGDGSTVERHTPVRAAGVTDAVSVAAGGYHSLASRKDGTVVDWGWNVFGQLGDGTSVDRWAPKMVPGLAHVTGLAGGLYHSLAVHDDGRVSAWGWNGLGQLGDGTTVDRLRPVKLAGPRHVTAVAAGFYGSLARRDDGRVLAWGWNGLGQLGDGTTVDRPTPQLVPSLFAVHTLASGALHSVAG